MGTRHLIFIQLNGEYKLSQYGQWDGYLEGQGLDVLNFLRTIMVPDALASTWVCTFCGHTNGIQYTACPHCGGTAPVNIMNTKLERFKYQVNKLRFATNEEVEDAWLTVGATKGQPTVTMELSERMSQIYPSLHRDTGAKMLSYLYSYGGERLLTINGETFSTQGDCEYGYVIDLDNNKFEVYQGWNKTPLDEDERFYDGSDTDDAYGYYPLRLLSIWDMSALPDDRTFLMNGK